MTPNTYLCIVILNYITLILPRYALFNVVIFRISESNGCDHVV